MCVHAVEDYSALKISEVLTHATTWMSLENVLSEMNQTNKDKYFTILLL